MRSSFRFFWAVGAGLLLAGCASWSTEERLTTLEGRTQNQQVLDLRISHVEDRLTRVEGDLGNLHAAAPAPGKEGSRKKGAAAPEKAYSLKVDPPQRTASAALPPVSSADPVPGSPPAPQLVPQPAPQAGGASAKSSAPPASPGQPAQGAFAGYSYNDQGVWLSEAPRQDGRKVEPKPGPKNYAPAPAPASAPAPSLTPPASAAPKKNMGAKTGKSGYDAALEAYEQGRYASAQDQFASFLQQSPGSSLAPNAMYWLGECYYSLGKLDTAIVTFKDVAAKYPKHPKAAAALLKAGYSYAKLKDMTNARFYWQILLDDFPGSEPAKMARKRMEQG